MKKTALVKARSRRKNPSLSIPCTSMKILPIVVFSAFLASTTIAGVLSHPPIGPMDPACKIIAARLLQEIGKFQKEKGWENPPASFPVGEKDVFIGGGENGIVTFADAKAHVVGFTENQVRAPNKGKSPKINGDSLGVFELTPERMMMVVANGYDGQKAASIASNVFVNGLRKFVKTDLGSDALKRAFFAGPEMFRIYASEHGIKSLGTTATAFERRGDSGRFVHVGQGTGMILRNGAIIEQTIKEGAGRFVFNTIRLKNGEIRPLSVTESPFHRLLPGDVVILATHGLTKFLSPERIARIINPEVSAEANIVALGRAAQTVADRHHEIGNPNISVLVYIHR